MSFLLTAIESLLTLVCKVISLLPVLPVTIFTSGSSAQETNPHTAMINKDVKNILFMCIPMRYLEHILVEM